MLNIRYTDCKNKLTLISTTNANYQKYNYLAKFQIRIRYLSYNDILSYEKNPI